MRHRSELVYAAFVLSAALAGASPASAQPGSAAGDNQARMISVLMLIDTYKVRCEASGEMDAALATRVRRWEGDNQVGLVRDALATVRKDAAIARALDADLRGAVQSLDRLSPSPCKVLDFALNERDTQFAKNYPAELAALARAAKAPQPAQPDRAGPRNNQPAPGRPGASDPSTLLATQIEGFAFDWNTTMGIGGGMMINTFPVVLFKSGEALTDVEGLGAPGGILAHKQAHPEDWTRWRRQAGKLQTLDDGKWDDLGYQVVYAKLPAGFTLAGRYSRLSGTGNVALGGSDSVTAYSVYDFWRDGRVIRGGGIGGYSATGGASVATSSIAPSQRGRYTISGVTLQIRYDDGSGEAMILVTDPSDPTVIWLDGYGFTQKK